MRIRPLSLALLVLFTALGGCSPAKVPSRAETGVLFPSVTGESLERKTFRIPEDLKGRTAILLVGYEQRAQFDIDRWILGFLQLETPVRLVEVPTIAGMMPRMVQGMINDGMRSGIPEEDWKTVVTVYQDAEKIIRVFGNERPQSALVVVLDKDGIVRGHQSSGYSATRVKEVDAFVRTLQNQ